MSIRSLLKLPVVGYESEAAFVNDLNEMMALAKQQPGFISVQIWKSHTDKDPIVYMVESEWESKDAMSAMEHHDVHEEVMSSYPHQPIHLRLVPWQASSPS